MYGSVKGVLLAAADVDHPQRERLLTITTTVLFHLFFIVLLFLVYASFLV